MPTGGITPAVTTTIGMEMNLDARLAVTLPGAGAPIDFADPTTYNNATSQTVYDAKGQGVALTYYFQKASTDTWNVYVAANGTPIATAGGNPAASTTITFPANGGTPTAPVGTVAIDIPSVTNAAGARHGADHRRRPRRLEGDPVRLAVRRHRPGAGRLRVGPADRRAVRDQRRRHGALLERPDQAGRPDRDRELSQPAGPAAARRQRLGRSFASGDPLVGVPGDGNLGVLQAGALEESNVDLTAELVDMITAQRVYQANAQTIKTQDQILQTIVNLPDGASLRSLPPEGAAPGLGRPGARARAT